MLAEVKALIEHLKLGLLMAEQIYQFPVDKAFILSIL